MSLRARLINMPDVLSEDQVCQVVGISKKVLRGERLRGDAPPMYKVGRSWKCNKSGLTGWMDGKEEEARHSPGGPEKKRELGIPVHGGRKTVQQGDRFTGNKTKRKARLLTDGTAPRKDTDGEASYNRKGSVQ